jgi:phosphatidylinositol alpha-mannosyltransferase
MKVGIVCPYGWDTPGGVQIHVRELALHLIGLGHDVSVLAPVTDESSVDVPWLVSAGRPIAIPYNGAVARVLFGPVAASRVRQWIAGNDFDVLHIHEPAIPSISLLACWAADGPVVATFHAASSKLKAMYAVAPILEPALEKLRAKIAVSESARRTLKDNFDTEAVVIPNGIDREKFENPSFRSEWKSPATLGFIGRFDEPRKGLEVLLKALPQIVAKIPHARLLVAGPGDEKSFSKSIPASLRSRVTFLGRLSEEEKTQFFKSVDLYVAPNTGGESFGIILAEAMASQTAVVASDIPAFVDLLRMPNGETAGAIFTSESDISLADTVIELLSSDEKRMDIALRGHELSAKFDWDLVATQLLDVYEMATSAGERVGLSSDNRPWNRLRDKLGDN